MNNDELKKLEETLWKSADTLRANSDLKSSEYSTPVMGLIFLKFADNRYNNHEKDILQEYNELKGTRREKPVSQIAVEKCGFYLPDHARYDYLLSLPEDNEVDKAIKKAMESIEEYKPELKGVLPQDGYFRLTRTDKTIPNQLLKNFSNIPKDASYDMFGQIYEYFLGNFAMAEGQGAVSSSRPGQWCVSWSTSSRHTTARSLIQLAVPAVCSSSRQNSWNTAVQSLPVTKKQTSLSTARKRPSKQ
jgi:type I restriction enzyme M protein